MDDVQKGAPHVGEFRRWTLWKTICREEDDDRSEHCGGDDEDAAIRVGVYQERSEEQRGGEHGDIPGGAEEGARTTDRVVAGHGRFQEQIKSIRKEGLDRYRHRDKQDTRDNARCGRKHEEHRHFYKRERERELLRAVALYNLRQEEEYANRSDGAAGEHEAGICGRHEQGKVGEKNEGDERREYGKEKIPE